MSARGRGRGRGGGRGPSMGGAAAAAAAVSAANAAEASAAGRGRGAPLEPRSFEPPPLFPPMNVKKPEMLDEQDMYMVEKYRDLVEAIFSSPFNILPPGKAAKKQEEVVDLASVVPLSTKYFPLELTKDKYVSAKEHRARLRKQKRKALERDIKLEEMEKLEKAGKLLKAAESQRELDRDRDEEQQQNEEELGVEDEGELSDDDYTQMMHADDDEEGDEDSLGGDEDEPNF